jgi:hypothetical protein
MVAIASALYRLSGGAIKTGVQNLYFPEHVSYYSLATLTALLRRVGWNRLDHFSSSTDMAKYKLALPKKALATALLGAGKLLGKQNRLVAMFRRAGMEPRPASLPSQQTA